MTDPRPKLSWSGLAGARVGIWGLGREGQANLRKLLALGVELIKAYRETGDHDRADALYVRVSAAAKAKWGNDYIDPDTVP